MRKKIDSYLIIGDGEEEKDKSVSCVARMEITNYSINEKRSIPVMDAVKFIEERNRMCKSFGGRCKECPGFDVFEEAPCMFDRESTVDATAQIAIVEEWSAAHPHKTRQSELLKQCPEAAIDDYGVLRICPCLISTSHRSVNGGCAHIDSDCIDCRREFWMQEVE